MNKKLFFILIIITLIAELVIAYVLIGKIDDVEQDSVKINECVKSVEDNFGDESRYSDALSYCVLDNDGALLYENSGDVSLSVNQAIKNNDTILELQLGDSRIGTIIFKNTANESINKYKSRLVTAIIVITLLQLILVVTYYIYLRKTIIKPFEVLCYKGGAGKPGYSARA